MKVKIKKYIQITHKQTKKKIAKWYKENEILQLWLHYLKKKEKICENTLNKLWILLCN